MVIKVFPASSPVLVAKNCPGVRRQALGCLAPSQPSVKLIPDGIFLMVPTACGSQTAGKGLDPAGAARIPVPPQRRVN